ncbi:hypothetical protein [Flaviaesturariibacter aridisoli]|uniref:Uncharacterized protein n=1 Tax=Flaviaesturariibacter aridisoli TaxID=2545761 RepID=A0A4R4EAK1_9BACT|nr:hypothetical protein [Flaviaesturariibacter aridisoli]TCZ74865.1 hypothetical protein E0486_00740 [Flaviaesturariibacter aridisoli]
MDPELHERLDKLERHLAGKKKDLWDKLAVIAPLLLPVALTLVGWHFTNEHNRNQLELQRKSHESELQVAYINSSVGQSELIKDFMQQLTNPDTAVRNIAIEAVLYAAPTPGKRIVEIIARNEGAAGSATARNALQAKRSDLVEALFAAENASRLQAATEIMQNWSADEELLHVLLERSGRCLSDHGVAPDCADGIYQTVSVLPSFTHRLLQAHKPELQALLRRLPRNSPLTMGQGAVLAGKIE